MGSGRRLGPVVVGVDPHFPQFVVGRWAADRSAVQRDRLVEVIQGAFAARSLTCHAVLDVLGLGYLASLRSAHHE